MDCLTPLRTFQPIVRSIKYDRAIIKTKPQNISKPLNESPVCRRLAFEFTQASPINLEARFNMVA